MIILQARPVPNQSDNEGERKDNEDNDEKDESISVPGSSYVKLVRFTPQPVLPGITNTTIPSKTVIMHVSNLRNLIMCILLCSNVHPLKEYTFKLGK